jgi:hypothetical protein
MILNAQPGILSISLPQKTFSIFGECLAIKVRNNFFLLPSDWARQYLLSFAPPKESNKEKSPLHENC